MDVSAVTTVTLHETDRAYGAHFLSNLVSYGQDINSACVVRVINPDNVAVNEMIAERNQRLTSHLIDLETMYIVYVPARCLKRIRLTGGLLYRVSCRKIVLKPLISFTRT